MEGTINQARRLFKCFKLMCMITCIVMLAGCSDSIEDSSSGDGLNLPTETGDVPSKEDRGDLNSDTGTASDELSSAQKQEPSTKDLDQVFNEDSVIWDRKKKALRIKPRSDLGSYGDAYWKTSYEFSGEPFPPRKGERYSSREIKQQYYGDISGIKRMKGTVRIRRFPKVETVQCEVIGKEGSTEMCTYTITGKSYKLELPTEYMHVETAVFDKGGNEMKSDEGWSRLDLKAGVIHRTGTYPKDIASMKVKIACGKVERTVPFDLRVDGK